VLFARDFWLAAIALFVFPPAMIPVAKVSRKIRRVSKKAQYEMGGISKVLLETFGGIEVVKAFGFEQQVGDRFNEQGERVYRLRMKRERLNASVGPALEFLGAIGGAAIIWYGGSQVLEGHTTPGNFFSFMTALFMIYDPVVRMGKTNNQIQTALASAERVFHILDEELSPCETEGDQELDGDVTSVEVKDLHFSYKPGVEVLKGVDFEAEKGQIVALVGESGSGKSTMLKLLPRFYQPDSGSIAVNGTDIRRFRVDSLRSKIAVVTQDAYLFDDTVFNNILMGRRDATEEEVFAAAKAARVDVFIDQLENGFETMVGERGDLLSGGQKQRVTIARAILRDAPILILDEATSSLDSESEKEIQDALNKLMVGRTTFVIAHRLSTVLHADQILFMKEGVVAERGRHDQLLERDGDYARLCKLQFGEE
jgi:subfamily B ATP-binding cassette protein MsbA